MTPPSESHQQHVVTVLGTRPEAIKLAPVIRALNDADDFHVTVISTGQHREMLKGTLGRFGVTVDVDLDMMKPQQTLGYLTATAVSKVEQTIANLEIEPAWVLVQGDTTSAMAAGLAGFYQRVRVGHVEAGLRSGTINSPFPEEANRRILSVVAALHFAPTLAARNQLISEGHDPDRVLMTGNTVIDALLTVRKLPRSPEASSLLEQVGERRLVLLTAHRRENWEHGLDQIFKAVLDLVNAHDDIAVVAPLHKNPIVLEAAEVLDGHHRIIPCEPLPYHDMVAMMDASYLILTDSGGLQEEAPALRKPVLVLRNETERPEAIDAGVARLVGPDRAAIVSAATRLLNDDVAYADMARGASPFGDGTASAQILDGLRR